MLHYSKWVPSKWVKTADKNIPQVIRATSVHQLMSCESKSFMFARNKSIIKMFWTSCLQLKYKSSIHNIAFSSENVTFSESGEKYAQIKHHLQVKITLITCGLL